MELVKLEHVGDYVIVSLNRPKVNAINHQLVKELRIVFADLEKDETVKGAILTGNEKIFSAGLDLIELYDYNEDEIKAFLIDFGQLHIDLVRFTKPMIAAITGHAPAGGTVLALAADYRIMNENPKLGIGLNEVAVNVQINEMMIESYAFWLGKGNAHRNILGGKLLNPQEALEQGLVDKLVPQDQVLAVAKRKMNTYLQADNNILINTKKKLRKSWYEAIEQCDHSRDLTQMLEVWWHPDIRLRMQMFITMLQSRNK